MTGRLCLVSLLACLLAGCAAPAPTRPMGQSVRRAMAAQYLNPDAGGAEPVAGLDGPAGQDVLAGYRAGFAPESTGAKADLSAVPLNGAAKQ